jgi:hypothetical protein
LATPITWGTEQAVTTTGTRLYGKAAAQAWDRLHPRLTRRAAWLDHDGPLPLIEGTVIRLVVEKPPSGGVNKPVWLWWSGTGATEADVDRCRQSFLRLFDIEHTFRLFKQTLGWTKPRLRSSEAADRWTWLVNRRLRPAPARPSVGYRPPQTLGEAGRGEQTDTRPRSQRVQEPPHEDRLTGWCTETIPSRPWSATWCEKPPPCHPSRRGQSLRHRRAIQPPRPPQGRHKPASSWLKTRSGAQQ